MLLLEEGFLIYGTVLSVIRVLPGGLCHFWQPPLGFEDTGGRQKASLD